MFDIRNRMSSRVKPGECGPEAPSCTQTCQAHEHTNCQTQRFAHMHAVTYTYTPLTPIDIACSEGNIDRSENVSTWSSYRRVPGFSAWPASPSSQSCIAITDSSRASRNDHKLASRYRSQVLSKSQLFMHLISSETGGGPPPGGAILFATLPTFQSIKARPATVAAPGQNPRNTRRKRIRALSSLESAWHNEHMRTTIHKLVNCT